MKNPLSAPEIKAIESKLLKVSRATGRSSMETRILFLLERAAARMLLDSLLQQHLIFKGGYVALRVYDSPRFTSDLDAVIKGLPPEEAIQRIRTALGSDLGDGAWFSWDREDTLQTQGEYGGRRLRFRAGIGDQPAKIKNALIVGVDLGIGDPVTPAAYQAQTFYTIGEGSLSWQVYPVETMLAEKIHALVMLGDKNSRSKDVYDIDLFWQKAKIDDLRSALKATFAFRKDDIPVSFGQRVREIDPTMLKKGWASAVLSLKGRPQFEDVLESLISKLSTLD